EAILLTHDHFDHIAGLDQIRALSNAPVYVHQLEQDWLVDPSKNGSALWLEHSPVSCKPADILLKGGETLSFFGETFQVIHTPGHSPGSVTYQHQVGMFSGDVLFAGSIGRTDLPGGDYQQLQATLRTHFLNQPEKTRVFPGHGSETTIGREKISNPFLQ
ncbi:MAG: MBL fold metallo-hydrolase, partial [Bacillales bacterium]